MAKTIKCIKYINPPKDYINPAEDSNHYEKSYNELEKMRERLYPVVEKKLGKKAADYLNSFLDCDEYPYFFGIGGSINVEELEKAIRAVKSVPGKSLNQQSYVLDILLPLKESVTIIGLASKYSSLDLPKLSIDVSLDKPKLVDKLQRKINTNANSLLALLANEVPTGMKSLLTLENKWDLAAEERSNKQKQNETLTEFKISEFISELANRRTQLKTKLEQKEYAK